MGIFDNYKKNLAEKRAYQGLVAKETLAIRRKAYSEEAKRQAAIQGRQMAIAKANRPTFMQRISTATKQVTPIQNVARQARTKYVKSYKPMSVRDWI